MDLPSLSIALLGGFQIAHGETALSGRFKPRLQALIAYLLLQHEGTVSRQQLAFHFWPDSSEAQARANVRKMIYRLRHVFPQVDDYLDLDGTTISRRAGIPLRTDVFEFEAALERAGEAGSAEKGPLLQSAVNLYAGDLLPDFYDDWVLAPRERLRMRYLQALKALAEWHEQQGDYASAARVVRQLLRADPLVEEAYRHLMRLQALGGDVAGALRTYHRCVRHLEQELGVEPSAATQAAYRRLLDRRAAPEAAPARPAPQQFPLVGRAGAWQQLLAAWREMAAGRAQAVVIAGEAGIGKTRLAEELLSWAGRQGIAILSAACFATEAPLPLHPVADWLRADAVSRALPGLPARWRSELARVLPELLAADPALAMPPPLTEAWQQQHFYMALAEAVTAGGEPLLLFLDDLHWADAETLAWLHFLGRHKSDHRFLLVTTVRSGEPGGHRRLPAWQQTLARLLPVQEIALERLAPAETAALAGSVLGRQLPAANGASLHRETEGNPLFTVEMVRAGLSQDGTRLPEKVRSVIELRLRRLSPAAQEVAALAAVSGRRFAFPLLQAASPQSEGQLLDSLDELWQRQIIREQGEEDYDFSHDKIREVALDRLSAARRRWWHGRVALALEQLSAGQVDHLYGRIAGHYEAAGEIEKAIAAYCHAGEEAQALFANDEAVRAYRKALALLESRRGPDVAPQRTRLFSQLGSVLLLTGSKQEGEAAFRAALAAMPAGYREEGRLHRLLGDSLREQGRFEEALAAYNCAEAALTDRERLAPGPELEQWVELHVSRFNLYYAQGRIDRMQAHLDGVGPLVERLGTPEQRARYLYASTLLDVRRARYAPPLDKALHYNEQALAASRQADRPALICHFQFGKGFLRLWAGEEDQARMEFEAALETARQIGHEEIRMLTLVYLSVLYRRLGDPAAAAAYARQALAAARGGNWETYIAAAEANLAWLAWRAGEQDEARHRASQALDLWQGSAYPFQWLASVLLLDIALARGEIEKALAFAEAMLSPSQQRLPEALTQALEAALQADAPTAARAPLEEAVRRAREHRLL